ncbi:hypothetical protein Dvina_32650 [Dactylosporangium vinaceum]|uniref:CBM6 domain-containing protein n=1 Tax=Dactylosporangium vinaceum TaxID=53362 RepID=A0ABV5MA96_9ACTN|nr:hypothetical protein [Dactylosporangium vinaceum]UAB93037.1 hypothetical protein Dvina_32650 [Dactylosporangium vinaceum]
MTDWIVVAAAPEVPLSPDSRAEMTFTVTNPGEAHDRVVFVVEPEDGTSASWFSVAEPQRTVPPHGSVAYLVALAVPPGSPPGTYALRGCAYSADTAPEETSRRSGRVVVAVPATAPPPKRQRWPYAVAAGLVLVVLAVIAGLVFRPRGTTPTPVAASPAASGAPSTAAAASPVAGLANVTYEMEELLPPTDLVGLQPQDVVQQRDCCGVTWSGHTQMLVVTRAQGWSLTVAFTVPQNGTYTFSDIRTRSNDYANTVYVIDTTKVGGTFVGYSPTVVTTGWLSEGSVQLTAGRHTLTLAVVGHAAGSTNYNAGVDAVRFTQTAA